MVGVLVELMVLMVDPWIVTNNTNLIHNPWYIHGTHFPQTLDMYPRKK